MDAFGPTSGLLVTIILIGHRSRLPVLRRFAEFGSQPLTDQKDQSFHIDRVFLMHRNLDRAWRKIVIHGCLRFEIHQQAGYRAHLLRADLNRLRGRRLPAKAWFCAALAGGPKDPLLEEWLGDTYGPYVGFNAGFGSSGLLKSAGAGFGMMGAGMAAALEGGAFGTSFG